MDAGATPGMAQAVQSTGREIMCLGKERCAKGLSRVKDISIQSAGQGLVTHHALLCNT